MGGSKPGSITPQALGVEAAHRAVSRIRNVMFSGQKGNMSRQEIDAQAAACVNQLIVEHKLYWSDNHEKEYFVKQAQAHAINETKKHL
ncbi:hypothetical protein CI109_105935 [Kwoniella shandongensis]|uniref:Uncharacterized protein n=1 Tax=Kwoniella shandongensis TaxID=1734106 RepID=A0A5M6BTS6_9TREE|nr:uncharacterized protein CI109_006635 [Kwoniella shandongensis]KAA5524995.1 hypothetical protein CI109_006635 [Kwoniella shandongensis]